MAVAGGDGLEPAGLQRFDCRELGVFAAHLVTGDLTVLRDDEFVAEERRVPEFRDQRTGKLGEGIRQDDDLGLFPKRVEELFGAFERLDGGDDLLDLFETETVLLQKVDAVLHELVVVRLVAGRALEFGNAGGLRERDPDLRDDNALHV